MSLAPKFPAIFSPGARDIGWFSNPKKANTIAFGEQILTTLVHTVFAEIHFIVGGIKNAEGCSCDLYKTESGRDVPDIICQ
ncbi:hypothetical protein ADM96_11450 [Burkholderia sp. ST111]|nr:hypothetical protein ADM96_11450 [Burkholderia sp. ST111]